MLESESIYPLNTVIIGYESSGKTTLFSQLSGKRRLDEANIKGSTVSITKASYFEGFLIDTPGLNDTDSQTQRLIKKELKQASTILLVVRGTHFLEELERLHPLIENSSKSVMLIVTYGDKMSEEGRTNLKRQITSEKLPIFIVNTREMSSNMIGLLEDCMKEKETIKEFQIKGLLRLFIPKVEPSPLFFDRSKLGGVLALLCLVAMFFLPVMIAYHFSNFIQPFADNYFIDKMKVLFSSSPAIIQTLFVDDYGLFSLGVYSFIWAFPVVLLISLSKALTDESGLKDRIIDNIEPLSNKFGLSGRDIIPIITGFGCNVVAVFQSRGCHSCSRAQCISFISFGSACSYQIGATLSIFNAAHATWLFLPYILLLLVGGIIHNRVWFKKQTSFPWRPTRKAFIQKPTFKNVCFQVGADMMQFLKKAMPIFMLICIVAGLLQYFHIISYIAIVFHPLLSLLQLPVEAATTLAFSIIRKDGILMVNEGNGALFPILSTFQLFVLVFLASTLTSCIVTLSTIWKELGWKQAWSTIYRQVITAVSLTGVMMVVYKVFS